MNSPLESIREPAVPGKPVVDPANWTASELANRQDWILTLSEDQIGWFHAGSALNLIRRQTAGG